MNDKFSVSPATRWDRLVAVLEDVEPDRVIDASHIIERQKKNGATDLDLLWLLAKRYQEFDSSVITEVLHLQMLMTTWIDWFEEVYTALAENMSRMERSSATTVALGETGDYSCAMNSSSDISTTSPLARACTTIPNSAVSDRRVNNTWCGREGILLPPMLARSAVVDLSSTQRSLSMVSTASTARPKLMDPITPICALSPKTSSMQPPATWVWDGTLDFLRDGKLLCTFITEALSHCKSYNSVYGLACRNRSFSASNSGKNSGIFSNDSMYNTMFPSLADLEGAAHPTVTTSASKSVSDAASFFPPAKGNAAASATAYPTALRGIPFVRAKTKKLGFANGRKKMTSLADLQELCVHESEKYLRKLNHLMEEHLGWVPSEHGGASFVKVSPPKGDVVVPSNEDDLFIICRLHWLAVALYRTVRDPAIVPAPHAVSFILQRMSVASSSATVEDESEIQLATATLCSCLPHSRLNICVNTSNTLTISHPVTHPEPTQYSCTVVGGHVFAYVTDNERFVPLWVLLRSVLVCWSQMRWFCEMEECELSLEQTVLGCPPIIRIPENFAASSTGIGATGAAAALTSAAQRFVSASPLGISSYTSSSSGVFGAAGGASVVAGRESLTRRSRTNACEQPSPCTTFELTIQHAGMSRTANGKVAAGIAGASTSAATIAATGAPAGAVHGAATGTASTAPSPTKRTSAPTFAASTASSPIKVTSAATFAASSVSSPTNLAAGGAGATASAFASSVPQAGVGRNAAIPFPRPFSRYEGLDAGGALLDNAELEDSLYHSATDPQFSSVASVLRHHQSQRYLMGQLQQQQQQQQQRTFSFYSLHSSSQHQDPSGSGSVKPPCGSALFSLTETPSGIIAGGSVNLPESMTMRRVTLCDGTTDDEINLRDLVVTVDPLLSRTGPVATAGAGGVAAEKVTVLDAIPPCTITEVHSLHPPSVMHPSTDSRTGTVTDNSSFQEEQLTPPMQPLGLGESVINGFSTHSRIMNFSATVLLESAEAGIALNNHRFRVNGRPIGMGAFGAVYRALDLETGTIVAVKQSRFSIESDQHDFNTNEFAMWSMLPAHPNVISFHGASKEVETRQLLLVLEYASGGSITSLYSQYRPMPEHLFYQHACGIAQGLKHLHDRNVIHGDVKPENVLTRSNGSVAISDFGCSRLFIPRCDAVTSGEEGEQDDGESENVKSAGVRGRSKDYSAMSCSAREHSSETADATWQLHGTAAYMAPEVIMSDAGLKSDVWAYACTLLQLWADKKPWSYVEHYVHLHDPTPLMFYIVNQEVIPYSEAQILNTPRWLQRIVFRCFERDVQRRCDITEVLAILAEYSTVFKTHGG